MKNLTPSIATGALALTLSTLFTPAPAASPGTETVVIPHVGKKAQQSFHNSYLFADGHKAFAIAPGGAWFWRSDLDSAEEATRITLAGCQKHTRQQCVLFALNDDLVFDHDQWPTLWRPYLDREHADQAATGTGLGQRFYDLSLKKDGQPVKLSDYRGRVVMLHFWGSWCPTCCGELPSLQRLYDAMKTRPKDMEFVLVQVRETINTSQAWMKDQELALPLHDSGYSEAHGDTLQLADGKQIPDRNLAMAFPATYLLDKNGVVVFSHMGAILDWPEYQPFIEDVIAHSAK